MADVKCKICGEYFDREKIPYIKQLNRYSHADCAKKTLPEGTFTIIDPNDMTHCFYCGKPLMKEEAILFVPGTYAHKECREAQVLTDDIILDEYICNLFNTSYVNARIKRQIDKYVSKLNFTYSGILGTLKYLYEVEKRNIKEAKGGIGLVEFTYYQALDYYLNQSNIPKTPQKINIGEQVIHIQMPKYKRKKKHIFTFLDKGE